MKSGAWKWGDMVSIDKYKLWCIFKWATHVSTAYHVIIIIFIKSKCLPCRNWKTGNGSVLINNSKLSSLLNHCPAVIWNYSNYWLSGGFQRCNGAHSWVFACDLPEFIRVVGDLRTEASFSLPSLAKASLDTRPITSRADFSWTHEVDLRGRSRAGFDVVSSLHSVQCTMTNSCCKLRFGKSLLNWPLYVNADLRDLEIQLSMVSCCTDNTPMVN